MREDYRGEVPAQDCPFCGTPSPQLNKLDTGRMTMVCRNLGCDARTWWYDDEGVVVSHWNNLTSDSKKIPIRKTASEPEVEVESRKPEKLLTLHVKGLRHSWSFQFYGSPSDIQAWRNDGLEVYEVENTVPSWVPYWAVKAWCKLQDFFNFKF